MPEMLENASFITNFCEEKHFYAREEYISFFFLGNTRCVLVSYERGAVHRCVAEKGRRLDITPCKRFLAGHISVYA